MTRFVGDSIATRQGKRSCVVDGKDRRKYMEVYLKTGKHPLIDQTRQENVSGALTPLPTLDINRPHVFMDLKLGQKPLGRVVIELFEDMYPAMCASFRHRCLEGHHTLKGTSMHKLQPHFAAFGGIASQSTAMAGSAVRSRLQHIEAGLLSVHRDGTHFALTLGRALVLDEDYCVVGRVSKGLDIVMGLSEVVTDPRDAPEVPLTVAQCGTTDHRGQNETVSSAFITSAGLARDALQAAKSVSQQVSAGVADALLEGLRRQPPGALTVQTTGAKRKLLPESVTGLSDSDSDSDSEVSSISD